MGESDVPRYPALLGLLLAACGHPGNDAAMNATDADAAVQGNVTDEDNASTAEPANDAAGNATAPVAGDEESVRAHIDAIYASYENKGNGDQTLSPDFDKAWKRAAGDGLDYDPFCDCQDFEPKRFRHRVKSIRFDGDHAIVAVEFQNGFEGPEDRGWKPKIYDLLRTTDGWVVDDIMSDEDGSLKRAMKAAEPGSMGIG